MGVDAEDPRAREERRVTRVLELAEELLGLQRELEAAMRSGLFDIAAARYSRPSCPVSRTQYDLNMRAQTRVATREEPAPETRPDEPPRRVFQIVRADHPRERDQHDDVAGESENKPREGPRRRTNVPRVDAEEDETTQKETEGTETTRSATASARASGSATTSRPLARKPASWFGAFPPPQLRRAESSFRSCVDLAARMATVSSEIRALT